VPKYLPVVKNLQAINSCAVATRALADRLVATWKRTLGIAFGVALLSTSAACAPVITVPVGVEATTPVCAEVVLALPDVVLDQEKAKTNSQATAAWGEPGAAITFTCGVAAPDPTSEDCQSITTNVYGAPETFDWILITSSTGFSFVSYGREPAMMVQVPASLNAEQPTAALLDVAQAVAKVPATHACI
jgi:hypothetical protein